MKNLASILLVLSFISGCAAAPSRPDAGATSTRQPAVPTSSAPEAPSVREPNAKKSFGVNIDLSKFTAYSSANKPRSIQSEVAAFDLAISGIDDTDNDGKVDRVRYTVTTVDGSKDYERNLSDVEIVLANADPAAIEMIRSGKATIPAEYVQELTEKLQSNVEVQEAMQAPKSSYRVQLTPAALGCIWIVAGANASVAVWCLAAGWAYWACLVGALGFHTAISVLGCLAL